MNTVRARIARYAALAVAMGTMSAIAADKPASDAALKPALDAGLQQTEVLLALMDTDHSGKVSKEEFMSFMEKEFDLLDKNKDGVLDLNELRKLIPSLRHPAVGPGR